MAATFHAEDADEISAAAARIVADLEGPDLPGRGALEHTSRHAGDERPSPRVLSPREDHWSRLLARLADAGVTEDEYLDARLRLERRAPSAVLEEHDIMRAVSEERRRRARPSEISAWREPHAAI